MNKKIGILTQPLGYNYGGLLQAYALCQILKSIGYEPIVIDRKVKYPSVRKGLSHAKTILYKCLGKKRQFTLFLSEKEKQSIYNNTGYFLQKYIPNKSLFSNRELLSFIDKIHFNGYVVGSDQVWRPRYSINLPTYFLDFALKEKNVKKIAYAASFGVSNWEFSEEETKMAKRLIKEFDGVSVREDSGVKLCREYLDCEATHVLDPTLLLAKEHYINLFEQEKELQSVGNLFTYILDKSKEKENIIKEYEDKLNLKVFISQPQNTCITRKELKINIEQFEYPTVTKWLRSFYDAEFVITDSFHGCVFSILFNKPFIAILNHGRGASRFYSLLKLFDLEDRIYKPNCDFENHDIDWVKVNGKLDYLRENSKSYLISKLNG